MAIPDVSQHKLSELLSLEGRRAVVTGAAVGIGAAIAARLAEAGADVCVADLDEVGATAAADGIRDQTGRRAVACRVDVADAGSNHDLAAFAVGELGGIDLWVNNAGIYPSVPLMDMAEADWDRVLDVNLKGTFLGSQVAAARMIEQGNRGVIVNVASTAAFRSPGPGIAHYVSSKHGVLGLTKSLAVELGAHGIRVLAVAPTLIETPGIDANRESFRAAGLGDLIDSFAQRLPLGRVGVPDDVARVVLFCASDLAVFMTGSALAVDGGDLAQ